MSIITRIRRSRGELRPSEARVADWVLADPNRVPRTSTAEAARSACVSEPTVIRFCRAMGFAGYREFKLELAASLAAGVPYVHGDVLPGDHGRLLIDKVLNLALAALTATHERLDPDAVDRAVDHLAGARAIHCIGHGASGVVAQDAQHKLFRLGVPVTAYCDPHVHMMAAATMDARDVLLAISHTGRSKELLESVRLACENGATVISLTAAGSPLAALTHVNLDSGVAEDTSTFMPMASRLADLAIIDVLTVGVALRRGPEVIARLKRTKLAMADGFLKVAGE